MAGAAPSDAPSSATGRSRRLHHGADIMHSSHQIGQSVRVHRVAQSVPRGVEQGISLQGCKPLREAAVAQVFPEDFKV